MSSERQQEMEFLIRMPEELTQRAADALREVGVYFSPQDHMCLLDRERLMIFHGAEKHDAVGPPVNFGEDLPELMDGINGYLDERGITPRLPEYQESWTLLQRLEMLRLATLEVMWVGFRPVVSDNFPQDQECWREYIRQFPGLFPQDGAK